MIYEVFDFKSDALPFKYNSQIRIKGEQTLYLHWHEEIELICVSEGEGYGFNNSEKTFLQKGDILVVNSGEVHSLESETGMRYHCIIISRKFLKKNGIDITKINFKHFIRNKNIAAIFEEISSFENDVNEFSGLYMRTAVLKLFCEITKSYIADTSTLPYHNSQIINGIKGAINYIHENYKEKLSINEILDESGFSRAYFSREFKNVTGKSIIDYINFIRCSHAEELISSGEYSVSEAAELCGFSSMSYFSKTYRKFTGKLPSETIRKS